jgi:probable rRNA maturation factor
MKRTVPQFCAAQISVVNRQRRVPVDVRFYRRLLRDLLSLTRRTSSVVGLTIVGDRRMHGLNRRYRGIDRTTDVLAFPVRAFKSRGEEYLPLTIPIVRTRPFTKRKSDGGYQGESRGMGPSEDVLAIPHGPPLQKAELPLIPIGDIVISIETAERQAHEAGAALRDECRRLLIHGYLHLLGYDHERSRREADRMRRLERRLAAQLTGNARRTR